MAIQVKSGPGKVLDWGLVTLWGPELELKISLMDFSLSVAFDFVSDDGELRVDSNADERGRLSLRCYNFDDADGRGSARPVLIGESGDDLLFLHFRVFLYGKTQDRTLHYTLYRVSKEAVGWTPKSG